MKKKYNDAHDDKSFTLMLVEKKTGEVLAEHSFTSRTVFSSVYLHDVVSGLQDTILKHVWNKTPKKTEEEESQDGKLV